MSLMLMVHGCATPRATEVPVVEITDGLGQTLSAEQAVATMRQSDHVLLGEVHDNPVHHAERAKLLAALADRRPAVVFEQFTRSANAALAAPVAGDFDAWLDRAGFDRKGWAWPLHRPVIEAALAAKLSLRGGNLERDEARQIARQGASAAPADLRARLAQPLSQPAAEALDRGLIDGHCGQLPASVVPRMRDAQAARDASMADALQRALAEGATSTLLMAGNGHVRRDHGVPLWLERQQPAARVVSVGFLEIGPDGRVPTLAERAVYDLVWVTRRPPRPDPCAGFTLSPSAAPAAPSQ